MVWKLERAIGFIYTAFKTRLILSQPVGAAALKGVRMIVCFLLCAILSFSLVDLLLSCQRPLVVARQLGSASSSRDCGNACFHENRQKRCNGKSTCSRWLSRLVVWFSERELSLRAPTTGASWIPITMRASWSVVFVSCGRALWWVCTHPAL